MMEASRRAWVASGSRNATGEAAKGDDSSSAFRRHDLGFGFLGLALAATGTLVVGLLL